MAEEIEKPMTDEEARKKGYRDAAEFESRRKRYSGDDLLLPMGWDKDGNEIHIATGERYKEPTTKKE